MIDPESCKFAMQTVLEVRDELQDLMNRDGDGDDILHLLMCAMIFGHAGLDEALSIPKEDSPGMRAAYQYCDLLEKRKYNLDQTLFDRCYEQVGEIFSRTTDRLEALGLDYLSALSVASYALFYLAASNLSTGFGLPLDDDLGYENALAYAERLWGSEESDG